MDSGWNLKELLKTILTSEAYRRSSDTTPQLQESDPKTASWHAEHATDYLPG